MVACFLVWLMILGKRGDVGSCSLGTGSAVFQYGCSQCFPLRRVCICVCQEASSTNTGPLKLNFWFSFLRRHNSSINPGSNLYELRLVMMNSQGDFFLISTLLKANTKTGTYQHYPYVVWQPTFSPFLLFSNWECDSSEVPALFGFGKGG